MVAHPKGYHQHEKACGKGGLRRRKEREGGPGKPWPFNPALNCMAFLSILITGVPAQQLTSDT